MNRLVKAFALILLAGSLGLAGIAIWRIATIPRERSAEEHQFYLEKNAFFLDGLCEEYESKKHRPPQTINDLRNTRIWLNSGVYQAEDVLKKLDEILIEYNPDIYYEPQSGAKPACVWIRPLGSSKWTYWIRTTGTPLVRDAKEPSTNAIALHISRIR